MEKFYIERDITLFYITATSFPEGILDAFQKLHDKVPEARERIWYGISYPNGAKGIIYKAAVEEAFPGEGAKYGCDTFTVNEGVFISELIQNWEQNGNSIGETFRKLVQQPNIDENGYCLEIYENNTDVRCLVPLA